MAASNVITMAGAGAATGAAVGGPWGALAGGAVGLAAGLFAEYEAAESEKKKQEILDKAAAQLNTSALELKNRADKYYAENDSIGTKADVQTYKDLVAGYDPDEFVYDFDEFSFKNEDGSDKTANDYYAANKDAIIQKTSDALQSTAAGAGIGRGTGAANQIATGVANKNEELYKDALNAFNSDRNFAYNLWQSNITNSQNRLNQLKNATDTQISMYGNLATDYQNWQQAKQQTYMDLEKDKANQQLTLTLASIQL